MDAAAYPAVSHVGAMGFLREIWSIFLRETTLRWTLSPNERFQL